MSSNYSRPTSPDSGRPKPERSTSYQEESNDRSFEIQQTSSPPRQRHAHPQPPLPDQNARQAEAIYTSMPAPPRGYYYPQDVYHSRREDELNPERKTKSFSDPLARDTRGEPSEGEEYGTPDQQRYHLPRAQIQQPDVSKPLIQTNAHKAHLQSQPLPEPNVPWTGPGPSIPRQDQYQARLLPQVQGYYQQQPGQHLMGMPTHSARHHIQPPWTYAGPSHVQNEQQLQQQDQQQHQHQHQHQHQPLIHSVGGAQWRPDDPHMVPPYDPNARNFFPTATPAGPHGGIATGPLRGMLPGQQQPIPQLVRTRALTQATSGWSLSSYGGFEPIQGPTSASRHPAHLSIDGELRDITVDWTEEETVSCRRLVLFERVQNGSTIMLKFHPIERDQYDASTTVISCIYWKERKEYYLTSVDCIALLELIINQRFSVEEKNRVRRNLEVCKPLTISKTKAESESFFQLIMKFEPPRPRNIEKDLKVFPWSQLDQALQKIVAKYSANYTRGG